MWHTIQSVLFPISCLICHKTLPIRSDELDIPLHLCEKCQLQLYATPAYCTKCHAPLHSNKIICSLCIMEEQPFLTDLYTPFRYEGAIQQLIQLMKFNGSTASLKTLSQLIELPFKNLFDSSRPTSLSPTIDIIPIPSDRLRYMQRGFNPILHIAQLLALTLNITINYRTLHKRPFTIPQNQLSRSERLENLDNRFFISNNNTPAHILLMDDVYTTGATLYEASRCLKRTGAKSITAFTIAIV